MQKFKEKKPFSKTSWEPVQKWYKKIVGEEGHYYHQNVILPGVMRLLALKTHPSPRVLDLGCGQGILGRQLSGEIDYLGIDISTSLIKEAKKLNKHAKHDYRVADISKPLHLDLLLFSHAVIILALQNLESPLAVFKNASSLLLEKGKLLFVLNHPCFRIPRQSSWQIDEEKKWQYRRIDRYLTPMQIPIQAHPSQSKSAESLSFHYPLSAYTSWLHQAGFVILEMEEWCSDKVSTGRAARMENQAREEFPLFLTILARKISE